MKVRPARRTAAKDVVFDYRAYDVGDVAVREREGWVKCTKAEVEREWYMDLGKTFAAAGLVGMKRVRKA